MGCVRCEQEFCIAHARDHACVHGRAKKRKGGDDGGPGPMPRFRNIDHVLWCSTDGLRVAMPAHGSEAPFALDHAFRSMAAHERHLRADSGIVTRAGAADGPNNAIAELFVAFRTAGGDVLQARVRLTDTSDRYLLFRSTDAHVLRAADDGPTLRTHRASVEKDANTYVQVGGLSFFVRRDLAPGGGLAARYAHDRYASEASYREAHVAYLSAVLESASAQLTHHSEQVIFKLLSEQPGLVLDAVAAALTALARRVPKLGADGDLSLVALSLDVFTTRAACRFCQRAARRLHGEGGGLRLALERLELERAALPIRIASLGDLATFPLFIRFASAVAFAESPGEVGSGEAAWPTRGVIHALPALEPSAFGPVSRAIEVAVRVLANHDSCLSLLKTGNERTEIEPRLHALVAQLKVKRELAVGDPELAEVLAIAGALREERKMSFADYLRNLLVAHKFWEWHFDPTRSMGGLLAKSLAFEKTTWPTTRRLRALIAACEVEIRALGSQKTLHDADRDAVWLTLWKVALRDTRELFEGDALAKKDIDPGFANAAAHAKRIDELLRAEALESRGAPTIAAGSLLQAKWETVLTFIRRDVEGEIRELLDAKTITSSTENAACSLAHEFGLTDVYTKCLSALRGSSDGANGKGRGDDGEGAPLPPAPPLPQLFHAANAGSTVRQPVGQPHAPEVLAARAVARERGALDVHSRAQVAKEQGSSLALLRAPAKSAPTESKSSVKQENGRADSGMSTKPQATASPSRSSAPRKKLTDGRRYYTDDEIFILQSRDLAGRANVAVRRGKHADELYRLFDAIDDEPAVGAGVDTIVQPVHVGGNHWALLYIRLGPLPLGGGRRPARALFVDPLNPGNVPDLSALRHVVDPLEVERCTVAYQNDGELGQHSCGAWMVELAHHLVENLDRLPARADDRAAAADALRVRHEAVLAPPAPNAQRL